MQKIVLLGAALAGLSAPAHAFTSTGKASWYGLRSKTASGGRVGHMTAAHRHLPFGSQLRVTNLRNQRSVIVTANDLGPFVHGRVVDVSAGAAQALGFKSQGVAPVRVELVQR